MTVLKLHICFHLRVCTDGLKTISSSSVFLPLRCLCVFTRLRNRCSGLVFLRPESIIALKSIVGCDPALCPVATCLRRQTTTGARCLRMFVQTRRACPTRTRCTTRARGSNQARSRIVLLESLAIIVLHQRARQTALIPSRPRRVVLRWVMRVSGPRSLSPSSRVWRH